MSRDRTIFLTQLFALSEHGEGLMRAYHGNAQFRASIAMLEKWILPPLLEGLYLAAKKQDGEMQEQLVRTMRESPAALSIDPALVRGFLDGGVTDAHRPHPFIPGFRQDDYCRICDMHDSNVIHNVEEMGT